MRLDDITKNAENVTSFLKTEVLPNLKNPEVYDFICFTQVWGSTSLGFGGWGGSMMTSAITTLVEVQADVQGKFSTRYYVFFDGQFAYFVENPNDIFMQDKAKGNMADCYTARTRYNSNQPDALMKIRENRRIAKNIKNNN